MADKKNEFDDVPEKRMPEVKSEPKKTKANILTQAAYALADKYNFRFNLITRSYEIQELKKIEKGKDKDGNRIYDIESGKWRWYEDRDAKNILIELRLGGIEIGEKELENLIGSKFISEDYHPFEDFLFKKCPKWDEKTDWIELFLKQIILVDESERETLVRFFRKWFTGLVVNLIVDEKANQQCFVIIGRQGIFKTTWLHSIIPVHLRMDYLYSGQFDFENKDHKKYCAFKMMIDLDELQGFTKADHNSLKSVLTDPKVELRLPYAKHDTKAWRRASFCGSSNNAQFLSDETGSRRFLPFNIENIKIDRGFPIENMYAQALALYKNGFQYFFDQKDEAEVQKRNEDFHDVSIEEELIITMLKKPTEKELDDESKGFPNPITFMTTSHVNIYLAAASNKINMNETTKKRIGTILVKRGFKKTTRYVNKRERTKMWAVIKVENAKNEACDPDLPPPQDTEYDKQKAIWDNPI
jgi:predicted P-loop ATPase